jgi:hypothetical protein
MASTTPMSAAELCEAVRQGRAVDGARLDRILAIDPARGLLEVQAGTLWPTIAAELRPGDARAAAVRTTMATVGESVERNSAGPDGLPAVGHVASLTMVTPDGELRRLSRNRNPELFALAVGGQGLFGALYSVTLRVETLARAVEQATRPETLVLRPGNRAWQSIDLLLPPDTLERFMKETDERCSDWRMQEDDSFLRWACREFAEVRLLFARPDVLGAAVRSAQLRAELIDAAIRAGGRFQIATTGEATREQTDACYPQLRAFLAHKRRFDPDERIVTPWYMRQKALFTREGCEVRWAA